MNTDIQSYVAKTTAAPVHSAVAEMAAIIRTRHKNAQAVLAYGSALRDSNPENTLIDFYVLTQDFSGVSENLIARSMCKLVPPNVYYAEASINGSSYRCKYAVLPTELLAQRVKPTTANPYFWVRFAQPMRVVWTADALVAKRIQQILIRAMETAKAHARELAPQQEFQTQWAELFRNTYRTELRPEGVDRAEMIVDMQRDHFETISHAASYVTPAAMPWSLRRWQGKALSVLRLLKAAFTFQGSADYAAWKIKRHSGVDIEVKDWHRKHPVLASIVLLPKLLKRGGLK
jgi:uncharacterized protein (UPF0333 family)